MSIAPETSRRLLYVANEDFEFLFHRLPMARAARAAGFEVHVATRVNKGGKAIEAEGFVLHPIPFRRGETSPLAAIPTILSLRRVEGRIKPNLVHHTGLQCCVYGSLASFGKTFPRVNAVTGLGYIFTSATWRTRLLKQSVSWLLSWLLNHRRSLVLVQNPDDRSALIDLGIEPKRTVLIPGSGIDTDARQPLPEPEGPITFGFAGRLLTDKGIRALVAAHRILSDQGHEANLVIAGDLDPANPSSVTRDEVEEWSRRPGITWLGHIEDIASLWRSCHFAVLPSHREGLPVSLLEAAAYGRPMIAADAPGCREIVIEDQTGLLVPIEHPHALAQAILKLATSPQLRERYGKAARQLVENKLSAKIIGSSVVRLYDDLVLAHSRTQPFASVGKKPQRAGKVVVVTQHYAPFPSSTAGYVTDIANALAQKHQVVVISSSPDSASKFPARPGEPEVIEIRNWWPKKSALVARAFAVALLSIQVFIAVMRKLRRGDVVLCVTTPFTLPYAVALAARLRKAGSALIIYDLYPDSLVMAGLLDASSRVTRWFRKANAMMFRGFDAFVIIGRDMATKLLEYPKMSAAKINLIPNWATLPVRFREPDPENSYRKLCGGQFIVAMSGNAGFTHDPESVFEAARILQNESGIKFLLSGEGVGWAKLNAMQAASPLSNVTLIERVTDSELESFLSAGDIWVVPYRKNNTGVSVPSRIYNLLAIGRPIIMCSEQDAEAAVLMREEDIGWVTPPEDPDALVRTIVSAASASARTREKGRRAALVASRFTRQIALNAYRELMERLLDEQLSLRQPGSKSRNFG